MAQGKSRQRQLNNEPKKDKGGGDEWMTSFSDMMSLMFCLFAVLYGMSKINEDKFRQLAEALSMSLSVGGLQTKVEQKKEATDNAEGDPTVKIDSKIKQSIAEKPSLGPSPGLSTLNGKKMADLKELNKELKEVLKKNDMLSKVMMKVEDRGLIVGLLTDKLLFNLGEADLKDDSVEILNVITPVLKKYANPIRIEGNTCDLPIYTERFHSNWELSAMRAINVGQYLIVKKNINPDRVSVIGYGEYRPMFPNDTEENRSRNRRVDLVISKGNQMLYVEDPFEEKDEGKPAKPRTESSPEGNEPQVPVNEADFWENFVEGR